MKAYCIKNFSSTIILFLPHILIQSCFHFISPQLIFTCWNKIYQILNKYIITPLSSKQHHDYGILITGCTGSCQNDNFQHSQWPKFNQSDISILIQQSCSCWGVHLHHHYRQVSNIRCNLAGNKTVDHSDVVGASPVGAAPATSSFSTSYLASIAWAKATARRDVKH